MHNTHLSPPPHEHTRVNLTLTGPPVCAAHLFSLVWAGVRLSSAVPFRSVGAPPAGLRLPARTCPAATFRWPSTRALHACARAPVVVDLLGARVLPPVRHHHVPQRPTINVTYTIQKVPEVRAFSTISRPLEVTSCGPAVSRPGPGYHPSRSRETSARSRNGRRTPSGPEAFPCGPACAVEATRRHRKPDARCAYARGRPVYKPHVCRGGRVMTPSDRCTMRVCSWSARV